MGKKIALFAFSVLCITFALIGCGGGGGGGDTGNPVGPVASGPVANLSGTVKLSGKPLANVTVGLYKPEKAILAGASGMASLRGSVLAQTKLAEGRYSTKTDSDGRYSFTAVPVGEYTLIAGEGEPYQFARTGVILGSVTEQDAQLTPTGKVFGRLLLSGGQPVRGAWVYLAGTSYVSISDASGNFTINHVPSGQNFTLDILSTDGGTLQTPVNTINIGPAENKSLGDLTLAVPVVPVQPASVINGQVNVADSSVPASALNALMVVVSSGDNLPLIAYTDSSGKFSLNVKTVGSYNVSVVGGEFVVAPGVQTVPVSTLGSTVTVQPFVLSKPTVVLPPTTQFYAYGGTINKRSKAFNEPDNAGVPLTLTSTDAAANVFSAVTSPTGSFTFSVPAGSYNLAVGGGYALETTFANPLSISASTVLNNVIWVVPTQVFTANFIVSGSLTKVTRVNGETDESNVIVTLTPTTGDAVTFAGATTPTGSFAIRVPAGTYNLAVTGDYKFETAFTNPVNVSAAVTVGTGIRVIPAVPAPANYVVSGTALKTVFAAGDTGQGGFTISLISTAGPATTYTGLVDAAGNYSITVPAGTYNMSVVSSIYRPESTLAQVVVTSADVSVPSFNLQPIQAPVVVYTVDGAINKTDFISGETDDGGVIITLTNIDASAKLYSAVTTAGGTFSFKVEPGTYTLAINSGYKFATTFSNPVDASVGNVSISPIDVRPAGVVPASIGGSVTPASPNKHYRVRIEKTAGSYTDNETTEGAFYFNNLAPGEYKIVVLPDANGYYGESALLNVAEGENLTGVSLAPTLVVPLISDIFAPENVLTVSGSNLASDTAAPPSGTAVPGDTKILVDGNLCDRPTGFTLTPAQDQATIGSIAPGKHNVVVERLWHRPNTTETFILKSSPVPFKKVMGSPLDVKVDDITDVGAKISWTNANFTSKSVVNVIKVSDNSQVASVVLDGTSFQVTGLLASTDYVAHVYNRYGDVESTPTSVNFTTRSNVNFGISSFALPNTDSFRGASLFGFEVINGVAYVGSIENDSTELYIRSFDLTTGAQVATATILGGGSIYLKASSMTSASTGLIFLQFTDSTGTGISYVNCFKSALGAPIASASIPGGAFGYDEAQIVYADNRLFSVGTWYELGQSPFSARTDLIYFDSPDTAAGLSAPQFFFNKTDENRSSAVGGLAMANAKITADANSLYLAVASFSITPPVEPGTIDIKRFAFSNLENPVNVKTIDTGNTSMAPAIEQIAVGGGRIYMIADANGNRHFHIDARTGYTEDFFWSSRGNYGIDVKGRLWIGQISISGDSFIQFDSSMKVEKYLPVKYFASDDGSHPVPGEFIKTDKSTGSFYMLHYNNAENLAVYFYPSSY